MQGRYLEDDYLSLNAISDAPLIDESEKSENKDDSPLFTCLQEEKREYDTYANMPNNKEKYCINQPLNMPSPSTPKMSNILNSEFSGKCDNDLLFHVDNEGWIEGVPHEEEMKEVRKETNEARMNYPYDYNWEDSNLLPEPFVFRTILTNDTFDCSFQKVPKRRKRLKNDGNANKSYGKTFLKVLQDLNKWHLIQEKNAPPYRHNKRIAKNAARQVLTPYKSLCLYDNDCKKYCQLREPKFEITPQLINGTFNIFSKKVRREYKSQNFLKIPFSEDDAQSYRVLLRQFID